MAIVSINTIKNWFKTGMIPTQDQFWSVFDSFRHKEDKVPVADVEGINELLSTRASQQVLDNHLAQKGAPNGYAPLDEFTKLAAQYLNIVNDLVTGGATALLSAEQGKVLQTQISAINTLLTSDNVNLDTIQELVDAIETVQMSLSTILVNDLTTGGTTKALTAEMGKLLQTNKVDKVAGERLINAAEITKLAGLSNVVTTVKTILSTALATQDIAGFVTYINTLAAPLVVGANEIVEYKTSDTGRVFKLLLRGRSFGVGQPAIVAADVIETTEFLNKDIRLSNYPSTRNDGQLPTNKVLAPDVNGNLKLYTIATAPAPYLDELIPGSYLPSNTGNFILKGSFFTPNMTVQIVGQTVNYTKFISDNEVHANVTTGSAEGNFDVILNNGISITFNNALLIVLGVVHRPVFSDYSGLTNAPTFNEGEMLINSTNIFHDCTLNYIVPVNKDFRIQYTVVRSPLYPSGEADYLSNNGSVFFIKDLTLNQDRFNIMPRLYGNSPETGYNGGNDLINTQYNVSGPVLNNTHTFERKNGVFKWYVNGLYVSTYAIVSQNSLQLRFRLKNIDLKNIKYIELAT